MLKKLLLTITLIGLFASQNILSQVNNCLDFDGTDDYVSLILNDNLEGDPNFTIEMWANASSYKDNQTFFGLSDNTTSRIQISESSTDGYLVLSVCKGSNTYGVSDSKVFTTGEWFHLAMVFNGSGSTNADRLKLYINGEQITLTFTGTIPATPPTVTSAPLLGAENTSSNFFIGKMDEARVWYYSASAPTAAIRSQDQIKEYMNTTLGTRTGLLASYHFDEGTAGESNSGVTTLNDKSGSYNHYGTLNNFALSGTTSNWVSRVYPVSEDNCLQFDGADDYVNLAGLDEEIDNAARLTIEMWVNAAALTDEATLFSKYYSYESRTQIQLNSTGDLVITLEQGTTSDGNYSQAFTTSAPIAIGQWSHLSMVYNGAGSTDTDKLKFYINGVEETLTLSGTINTTLNSTSYPALLGAQGAGLAGSLTNFFNGKMDEVKIWDVARTQAEIQSFMFTALAGNETGLVAYYNFNQATAGGTNTDVTVLNDLSVESAWTSTTSAKNFGVLTNFALSGSTSNWISSSISPLTGSGTSGDPYLIANLENLEWLSLNSSKWSSYFKQTADIDASSTSTWNGGAGWSPIGNSTTNFTGTYDGDGHTIIGIYINRSSTNYLGFFGKTNTPAVIQNLGLVDNNITGTIDYIGGLVGNAGNSTIRKCFSTGTVTGSSRYNGGLFGSLSNNSTVENCYSTASVTGADYTGGFAGSISEGHLSYCYSKGLVTADGSNVGGFIGGAGFIIIQASFWDTETSGKETSAGGDGMFGEGDARAL